MGVVLQLNSKESVEVAEVDCASLQCRLDEIDLELFPNRKPKPVQQARLMWERKRVYEAIHPDTKSGQPQALGANRKQGRDVAAESAPTFTRATAIQSGRSERTVEVVVKRGRDILPVVLDAVEGTRLEKGVLLDELANLPTGLQMEHFENRRDTPPQPSAPQKSKADAVHSLVAQFQHFSPEQRRLAAKQLAVIYGGLQP